LNHTRTVNRLFLADGHPPGNLFARSGECLQFTNFLTQPASNVLQLRRRKDFSTLNFAHIKAVNRRAAFRDDARGGNIQM